MEQKKNWQDKIVDALMLRKLPVTNVPSYMYNVSYWTGSIALSALLWEFITGPLLLLYYNVAHPYTSTQFIINSVPFGSVILFTHTYGAYIMIVALYVHAMRHFLVGAYKKPRQWVWVIGVILFLLTLGVSFFGYNLIGDALSYDARDVAIGMASGVPLGGAISSLLFGLGTTAQIFSRLLGLHIILALSILIVFIVHFLLFEKSGATPSIKKAPISPAINSEEERKALGSWWPQIFLYTLAIVLITWAIIMIIPNAIVQINNLPSLVSPFPGPSPTSAAAASAVPYPPWFLLPIYKIADFLLPNGSPFTPLIDVGLIAVISLVMFALPFIDKSKYRSPIKRKFWTALAFTFISWLIVLTVWGAISPGVQITTNIQLLNLLPPFIVSFAIALSIFIGEKFLKQKISVSKILSYIILLLFTAGSIGDTIYKFSLIGLGLSVVTLSWSALISWYFLPSLLTRVPKRVKISEKQIDNRKKICVIAMIIIFLATAPIGIFTYTLPSTGLQSNLAGVFIGIILLLWGIGVWIYHYFNYVLNDNSSLGVYEK